jgi:ribosomal protein S18 acetylase RimI-like enzyme
MIRKMRVDDAVAVWDITTRSLGYDCAKDTVTAQIAKLEDDPHYLCLVWEDEATGEVLAFLQAAEYETLHSHGGWDVINLAVVPERQGEGIGRTLLSGFEEQIAAYGGRFVRLNSRVERTGAHAFYAQVGYDSDKVQKHFSKQLARG